MKSMSRRDFMSQTMLAGGALPIIGGVTEMHLGAKKKVSANEKVTVGLIGSGGMGRGDLATFLRNPEIECPIICDVDDEMLAKEVKVVTDMRGKAPKTVKDFRKVVDRKDIDVLLVATPDHWHALPTIYGCEAGKDVYVEKPLGKFVNEGRVMLETMKRTNRIVQMGTQWHSGVHWREAVECVQSGRIGKIRQVRAWAYLDWLGGVGNPPDGAPPAGVDYDMWLGPAPDRPFNPNRFHFNFRWYWDYAGGLMTDWAVHLINIVLWAMGTESPTRVTSYGGKRVVDDNSETPDTQIAVYEFPSYVFVWEHQMQGGVGINGHPHGICFSGSKGTVIVGEYGWELLPEPKLSDLKPENHGNSEDARPAHVRNFLDCVKSREQPIENLEVAHFVSTVAHLGNLALRTQSEIKWDAAKECVIGNDAANQLINQEYRKPWKLG